MTTHDDSSQLNGWKEISAYIGKGVRQAQRWEKLGMPVHRVGGLDGVVYAYREEIDAWRESSAGQDADSAGTDDGSPESAAAASSVASPTSQAGGGRHSLRRATWLAAVAAIVLFVLGLGGYSLFADPPITVVLSSPAEAGQGGSFRFHATGGEPGLRFAYRMMRNPRGGNHMVAPPVPRDPDGRFVWVFSTDCQTPPGRHEVSLADSNGRSLTKAVGVTVHENPACLGAVPDIVAESITVEEQAEAGGTVRCQFLLRNSGARTANPSMTRLRLSRSPMRSSISDVRLGDVPAPLLRPGESATFEPELTVPASVAPGTYYVWVVADNNSDNVESFTHNNYVRSTPLIVVARRK